MKSQEVRGKTMQGADLGFFYLPKGHPGPFADLFSREMVPGPKGSDQVIILLGQAKELHPKPLFHFRCRFVCERECDNLRDGQWVRLSHEEVEDAIDKDRGLAGPGSCDHHDIAVPGCLCQEPIPGIRECEQLTHRLLSAFSGGVRLGPEAIDTSATKPWRRGGDRRRRIRNSRNSHREE